MSSRSSIKLNLCASWVAHGVTLVIGFFLMPFVLHKLGDRSYGAWIFINSAASYAGLMYLGFGHAIQVYVAKHRAEGDWHRLNEKVNVILAVYLGMGTIAFCLAGLLAGLAPVMHKWDPEMLVEVRLVMLILGLNIAIGMTGSVFGGVLMGLQRFDLVSGIAIGADLFRLGLTVLFLRHEWGLVTLASIYLAATVLENLIYIVLAFRFIPTLSLRRMYVKLAVLKECFGFSLYVFLGHISAQLIYATDTLVIGFMLGAEAIVPYYIALRLCQFIQRPIQQIGEVCMPKAGELHAKAASSQLAGLLVRALGVAFLLTTGMFIGTVYFGNALLLTWVGPGYDESQRLLLVLLFAQTIALPLGVLRSILFGMGHVRAPAIMFFAEAVLNLVLSMLLIRPLGVMGVALGTAIPIAVIEIGLLLPYALKHLQLNGWKLLWDVLGPQSMPLLALVAYSAVVCRCFDVSQGWTKLVVVTAGGGAVLLSTWGVQYLVYRHANLSKAITTS